MESKQYRIMKTATGAYKLVVTHGLMDVETIGFYPKQALAREKAKLHAARTNVKPIILT